MKRYFVPPLVAISFFFSQCQPLNKIPPNTTNGVFSLNGNWRLKKSNDNNALVGTVVTVIPGLPDAAIRTLSNNSHCFRERDVVWRSLQDLKNGSFSLENLVDACNSSTVFRTAIITFVNNDEIRINGQKDVGGQLIQTWVREVN